MRLNIFFIAILIHISFTTEELKTTKRLTVEQVIDASKSLYVIDTRKEYRNVNKVKKNTKIKQSGSYTYEWSSHVTNPIIQFGDFLSKNSQGYADMTKYDYIILNIYSKKKTASKIVLVIYCQEGAKINAYKKYTIATSFSGWKEIRIPYTDLDDAYGADLKKVTNILFEATGWGCVPNKENALYIDQLFFTKMNYKYNMKKSEILSENYDSIINKLRFLNIGSGKLKSEDDKDNVLYYTYLNVIRGAENIHAQLNKKGLPFNYPMTHSQHMNEIYYKILDMVKGYSIKDGKLYKNKTYFDDIIYCLDYMHDNYYTKYNTFTTNNWWNWDIGVTQTIVNILVYLKDDLTQSQIDKYLAPVNKYIPLPFYTMCNRVDIAFACILSGALQHNYTRIALSIEAIKEIFNQVEIGDGIYEDGSFIQHDVFAYTGTYGAGFINQIITLTYILEDSCFRFDDQMKETPYNFILKTYLPFLYKGVFMGFVMGRSIMDGMHVNTGKPLIHMLYVMIKYLKNDSNVDNLKKYIKYIYKLHEDIYKSSASIRIVGALDEVILNDTIKPTNIINNFAKVYSGMDKAMAQIDGVALGISLSSKRIGRYEAINGANYNGWYGGEGMTYICLDINDDSKNFWKNINLYRLPGTTVTKAPRKTKDLTGLNANGNYDFVGGTYSSVYMVVAYQFGADFPAGEYKSDLVGNKGYFVFGNNYIFLGNNISCSDNYEVETIIENRHLTGKLYFGNKEITTKSGNVTSNYIYIENYGGIYLPSYKNVKYSITDKEYLEIYFVHGKKFKNGSYKYYILPKINKSEFKQSIIKGIEVLSNNNKISAVKMNDIKEYIFWQKGSFDGISVNQPCTLILDKDAFYISDPSHKLFNINVTFGGYSYNVKVFNGYTKKVKRKDYSEDSNKNGNSLLPSTFTFIAGSASVFIVIIVIIIVVIIFCVKKRKSSSDDDLILKEEDSPLFK